MPPTDLLDQLASADVDALRLILRHTLQRLIEAEASAYIGAEPGEHSPTRTTYRNGHRARPLDTRLGRLDLAIPKVRTGSFFPSLLERLNAEIDRRAKVVGIFPNTAALLRLVTAVLAEQEDEWSDGRRHFSQQSMAQLPPEAPPLPPHSLLEDLAA